MSTRIPLRYKNRKFGSFLKRFLASPLARCIMISLERTIERTVPTAVSCSGLCGGPPVFVNRQLCSLCSIIILSVLSFSGYPSNATTPAPASEQAPVGSKVLRLSVNEALGLFLSQNLDVLIAKYGIDYRKGQEVTARLFPNPLAIIGTLSSYTQGRT